MSLFIELSYLAPCSLITVFETSLSKVIHLILKGALTAKIPIGGWGWGGGWWGFTAPSGNT